MSRYLCPFDSLTVRLNVSSCLHNGGGRIRPLVKGGNVAASMAGVGDGHEFDDDELVIVSDVSKGVEAGFFRLVLIHLEVKLLRRCSRISRHTLSCFEHLLWKWQLPRLGSSEEGSRYSVPEVVGCLGKA